MLKQKTSHPKGNALYSGVWGLIRAGGYQRALFVQDLSAALVVTLMLIPQSLAYALLAGLPLQVGLYASVLPLLAYALFGTSSSLSVGPMAIIALLIAITLEPLAVRGSDEYVALAMLLALLSGVCLVLMGILRMGFLANFLSHPVMAAFITASAILISLGQLKGITGIAVEGSTAWQQVNSIVQSAHSVHLPTLALGVGSLIFLLLMRRFLLPLLAPLGLSARGVLLISRMTPLMAILVTTGIVFALRLHEQGVSIVGALPQGLPQLQLPQISLAHIQMLIPGAILISLIGFAESIAIARSLGAMRRQRVNSNRELLGLGAANVVAGFSGGMPVTGGLSRSVVNFDAGAVTPLAGVMTAACIALILLYFTGVLYYLPHAVLSAIIIVAVLGLANWQECRHLWHYSRGDGLSWIVTFVGVLLFGVEMGLMAGVLASLASWLGRSSNPHMVEVGRVPGTEHFRNTQRYDVERSERILTLRIDESLMFANAQEVENYLLNMLAQRTDVEHLVLMGSGINHIDASALDMLERVNELLSEQGVQLHLSEIKGPVLDRLQQTQFLQHLSGQVFLTQHQAIQTLDQLDKKVD